MWVWIFYSRNKISPTRQRAIVDPTRSSLLWDRGAGRQEKNRGWGKQLWIPHLWIGKRLMLSSSISLALKTWLRTPPPPPIHLHLHCRLLLLLALLLFPLRLITPDWSFAGSETRLNPVTLRPPSTSFAPTLLSSSMIIGFYFASRNRWIWFLRVAGNFELSIDF